MGIEKKLGEHVDFEKNLIMDAKLKTFLEKTTLSPKQPIKTPYQLPCTPSISECFVEKNKDGYCFDKKGCQPLIVDKKAKSSLKVCTKVIDFKKEAGDLCECSVKAGIR